MKNKFTHIAVSLLLLAAGCKKPDLQANLHVTATLRTAGDYIQNNYAFSLFAYAVQKAGMVDSLNNPNLNYTILLPDNTAFNTDSIYRPSDLDAWGADSLRFFVRNHLLGGKVFYNDVPTNLDNLYTNRNGISLYISHSSLYQSLFIDGVGIKTKDIALINGVIHVLAYPLKVSRGTVQDFLSARPDLHALVAGLKRFNLWDSLRTGSPITIFAPRDSSFSVIGLTPDSISRMDTTHYRPILFGGHVQLHHHLFVADASLTIATKLPLPGGYLFNMASFGCQVLDSARTVQGPLGPRIIPQLSDQQRITPYLDANHTDFLLANGIVHLINNVLVLPGDAVR